MKHQLLLALDLALAARELSVLPYFEREDMRNQYLDWAEELFREARRVDLVPYLYEGDREVRMLRAYVAREDWL
jgi:hypothetical protein